jgi:uncharacterized membrane protein YfcA
MILALLGALVIGISLGLLGSGGSILTLPVLVFILQRPEKLAIAESLAIVGSISVIGAIPYALRAQVQWNSILFFGLPGMLGAYLGGSGSYYISGSVQLTLFALVMFIVASMMLLGPSSFDKFIPYRSSTWLTIVEGFLVGCLTGFIGIGGGFLIVPSLVILCHLSMSLAIGTSLIIIAMNSFTAFLEQLLVLESLDLYVDWTIIGIIASIGILGSLSGSWIGKQIPQIYLRRTFGLSILVTGCYILINQF